MWLAGDGGWGAIASAVGGWKGAVRGARGGTFVGGGVQWQAGAQGRAPVGREGVGGMGGGTDWGGRWTAVGATGGEGVKGDWAGGPHSGEQTALERVWRAMKSGLLGFNLAA